MITSQSLYFSRCFDINSHWKASRQNRVKLSHADPAAFKIIFGRLYRHPDTFRSIRSDSKPFAAVEPVYQLANELTMPRLKNDIVDEIQELAKTKNIIPTPDGMLGLWKHLHVDDPLFQLYSKTFAWSYCTSPSSWPLSILGRGAMVTEPRIAIVCMESLRQFSISRYGDPRQAPRCMFHDHDLVAECTAHRLTEDTPSISNSSISAGLEPQRSEERVADALSRGRKRSAEQLDELDV